MDELMLMEYLRNKGIGKNMSEHEFMNKFKEVMSNKYRRNSYRRNSGAGSMRHGSESDYFPMDNRDMYDDFYMRRHNDYPDEFMGMFNSDRGQHKFFDRFNRMSEGMSEEDMYEMMRAMKSKSTIGNEHFNDSYARYIVSNMYHFENGRKYVGEKFDMTKAKEVCERYRGIIPQTVTHADVYVAINAQYHDYCELFKSWFGDGVEQKIIESAVIFWFKDDDYKDGFKLWNYFKED